MEISRENFCTKYLDETFSNIMKMIDNCYTMNQNCCKNCDLIIKECLLIGELIKVTRVWMLWRENMGTLPKYDFSLMYGENDITGQMKLSRGTAILCAMNNVAYRNEQERMFKNMELEVIDCDGQRFTNQAMLWIEERLIWIGYFKNIKNSKCLFSTLPKDIVQSIALF